MIKKIKEQVLFLYKNKIILHVNMKEKNRSSYNNEMEVMITNIYPSIFIINEINVNNPRRFSVSYTDIITKDIIIKELN